MIFSFADWLIVILFLALSLFIGLYYRKKAGNGLVDYFLGGRRLPWYVAGISMVATTFAADTPLAVTELVAKNGISGNWLWWNMLAGGMLTTFFFSKLWRRANILTELEFIELRYSGPEAAFLRGFKAVYMGLFMNALIIGWVNVAMMSIIHVFFDIPYNHLLWYAAGLMSIAAIYSATSGLIGVAVTDMVQFIIAMTGCIILAIIVVNVDEVGGISGLKEKLPAGTLDFFPTIGSGNGDTTSVLAISIGAFLAYTTVQWWASWYPGAEPGGGGYVAQRMMSAKDEKHAVFATLFFQIAHYCIRPWPWILVGLCTLILYPELGADEKKLGYVMAMKDYLPDGLKGLLFVAFLAAYMSTISTQLNWGASYLTNDLYKRFIKPVDCFQNEQEAQKHYVYAGRMFTIIMMIIALAATTQITSISGVWEFIIECGAGLGLILILRWYWWRINAWGEIVATVSPFIAYAACKFYLEDLLGSAFVENKGTFFITTGFTTISWIIAIYATKPTDADTLNNFCKIIKPDGAWNRIYNKTNDTGKAPSMIFLVICWLSSILMTYSFLFASGKIIFHEWNSAGLWGFISLASFAALKYSIKKTNLFTV